jgi:hypothetical protein
LGTKFTADNPENIPLIMLFLFRLLGIIVVLVSGGLLFLGGSGKSLFGWAGLVVGAALLSSSVILTKVWNRRREKIERDWQARMKFNPEFEELRKKHRARIAELAAEKKDGGNAAE